MPIELTIRPATVDDVPVLFNLVLALAEYEKLSHAVTGNPEALGEHLFGSNPYAETLLAEYAGQAVGFALFFHNYSTLLTKPGIYLEDLFVLPEFRRKGIGKAIFAYLAQLAIARNCGYLEWSVLDWNEPAIAFYRRMGASISANHRICRITGHSLTKLADGTSSSILRSAVPHDVPELVRLVQVKAELEQTSDIVIGTADTLKEHLFGSRNYAEATIVEQSGEIVGYATFCHNYSTFLTKPGLYLEDSFISPDYRHQKIDSAVLTHFAQLAVSRNCGRVECLVDVEDKPRIAFYESLGATTLPDWRLCRVAGDSLRQLAA